MDLESRLRIFKLLLEIVILGVGLSALISSLDASSEARKSQEQADKNYLEIMSLISEQNQQIDRVATICSESAERSEAQVW